MMRRTARILGGVLAVLGFLALAWTVTVWRWQDPFTALYTHYEQGKLARSLERQFESYRPPSRQLASRGDSANEVAAAAARYRRAAHVGQAIGRHSRHAQIDQRARECARKTGHRSHGSEIVEGIVFDRIKCRASGDRIVTQLRARR